MGLDQFWKKAIDTGEMDFLILGNTVLITKGACVRFVKWATQEKKILGFEGFQFDGKNLRSLVGCIADLSDLPEQASGYKESIQILSEEEFLDAAFVEFELVDLIPT